MMPAYENCKTILKEIIPFCTIIMEMIKIFIDVFSRPSSSRPSNKRQPFKSLSNLTYSQKLSCSWQITIAQQQVRRYLISYFQCTHTIPQMKRSTVHKGGNFVIFSILSRFHNFNQIEQFWAKLAKLHYTSCLDGVWIKIKKFGSIQTNLCISRIQTMESVQTSGFGECVFISTYKM